jgi:hypothetical protein
VLNLRVVHVGEIKLADWRIGQDSEDAVGIPTFHGVADLVVDHTSLEDVEAAAYFDDANLLVRQTHDPDPRILRPDTGRRQFDEVLTGSYQQDVPDLPLERHIAGDIRGLAVAVL